ncbi:MAG TPA: PfkB family carbohydrate kinase, partial [Candidatus Dormibacteraeota bacterium]|nr:PfkB family carbohydrate kinase [Candidatus Dormibacteraeota bacterium]
MPSAEAWPITAAGTLALDDLSTPAGAVREEPGGSAAYFALAAADPGPVHIVAALGADGAAVAAAVAHPRLDLTGVVRLPGQTYRWRAVHDPQTGAVTGDQQRFGVYLGWRPAVPAAAAAAPVCFVGSMAPAHQLSVLRQCRRARLRAADTMVDFIDAERDAVLAVLAAVDVAFLNERELLALAGERGADPLAAARSLLGRGRTRAVVWTRGP